MVDSVGGNSVGCTVDCHCVLVSLVVVIDVVDHCRYLAGIGQTEHRARDLEGAASR